jgi:hypothetical protein
MVLFVRDPVRGEKVLKRDSISRAVARRGCQRPRSRGKGAETPDDVRIPFCFVVVRDPVRGEKVLKHIKGV